ncbi:MAG: ABC transporter permease [Candidatus Andersenbacteria bacterium]
MTSFDLFRTAVRGLTTNIGRTLMTMLGIIIGVGAIVLVMSLGRGAQSIIVSQVEGVGGNTLVVRPGREPEGPTDFADTLLSDSLKKADLEALSKKSNVPDIVDIVPAVIVPGSVSYQEAVSRPTIFGWKADALGTIFQLFPIEGAFFGDEEIRNHAKVAVIGYDVNEDLFNGESGLGKSIRLRTTSFKVVGVLPKSGQLSFFNPDTLVVVPYTTAQSELLGIDYFHELLVSAADTEVVDQVAEDIKATLRERHNITDPEKDDFFVQTQQDILARISTVTQVLTVFLSSIAAISLVVGGVGIMNIMLVSVTERTQEIGLRKAIGATNKDILQQFLFEALLLTVGGGLIGTSGAVLLSYLVSVVASQQFNLAWPFSLPLLAIGLGLGMAAMVGLTFGLYPALKASRKDPIEALRYE